MDTGVLFSVFSKLMKCPSQGVVILSKLIIVRNSSNDLLKNLKLFAKVLRVNGTKYFSRVEKLHVNLLGVMHATE